MKNNISAVLIFLVLLFLASCSGPGETAGTGHGGEARVSGILKDSADNPLPNALVRLMPSLITLNADTGLCTTTDNMGNYSFENVEPGHYTFSAYSSPLDTIPIVYLSSVAISESADVLMNTVKPTGTADIFIAIPDSLSTVGMELRISGTTVVYHIGDTSSCIITVPAGVLSITAWRMGDISGTVLLNGLLIQKGFNTSYYYIDANHRTGYRDEIYFVNQPTMEVSSFWKADWGDGTISPWTSLSQLHHSWPDTGTFTIRYAKAAKASDTSSALLWADIVATTIQLP